MLAAWLAASKYVAVVSHESTLALLSLNDLLPDAVHLSVPCSRRHLPTLLGVNVHSTDRWFRPTDLTYCNSAVERGQILPAQLRRDAVERGRRVAALVEGALCGIGVQGTRRWLSRVVLGIERGQPGPIRGVQLRPVSRDEAPGGNAMPAGAGECQPGRCDVQRVERPQAYGGRRHEQ